MLRHLPAAYRMRSKVYDASVSEGLAARLYRYYGGVARYVLGVPSQLDTPQDMDALLRPLAFDLDACNTAQVGGGLSWAGLALGLGLGFGGVGLST